MITFRSLTAAATLVVGLTLTAQAQVAAPAEEALIRATVQTYFDGWAVGDSAKVSSAMHPSCHLKLLRNGEFVAINKRDYIAGFKPRAKGDTQGRILALHQTGHAAGVVSQIISGPNRYTDYFNLLKVNGRWYITDKVAYRQDR
jgi:hypothetical protein